MKLVGYLILALLAAPASLNAGDLSIGLGYPYLSAKYDFKVLSAEARLVTGGGVEVYSGRGYWNFHRARALKGFAGAEAGYIKFNTLDMKGTGYEGALFVGGEYRVAENFSLLMDFAPTLIMLRHRVYNDVEVSGIEYVVNIGFYYRFGKGGAKAPGPPKKARAAMPPPEPAAAPPQASTGTASPAAAVDTAALLEKLNLDDPAERRKAAFELGQIRYAPAVEPLLELLNDENVRVRGAAALALARIGDKRAVLPLIKALKDASPSVRASSAKALGNLKDKRALKGLEEALKDRSAQVSKAAAESLKKLARLK